jgi:hypothetical protein
VRRTQLLTTAIVPLALAASAAGLLVPGVYRDNAWIVPQNRGQDLLTLCILPVLLAAAFAAERGSARAVLVRLGLLGYLGYTYTGAAFAFAFNPLFPLYVALFSLSLFALASAVAELDPAGLRDRFDARTPRRTVAAFLALVAVMLTAAYAGQIAPFYTTGALPEPMRQAGTTTFFVYALDLGVVVPLAVIATRRLLGRRAWGETLAAVLLIKAATMGLALLSMTWFVARAGLGIEAGLTLVWAVIAAGGLALSVRFLAHCRPAPFTDSAETSRP